MKLTRHNGRSGKHGTYNPRHNDRRFDMKNSEHIDAQRARKNVYWDWSECNYRIWKNPVISMVLAQQVRGFYPKTGFTYK